MHIRRQALSGQMRDAGRCANIRGMSVIYFAGLRGEQIAHRSSLFEMRCAIRRQCTCHEGVHFHAAVADWQGNKSQLSRQIAFSRCE